MLKWFLKERLSAIVPKPYQVQWQLGGYSTGREKSGICLWSATLPLFLPTRADIQGWALPSNPDILQITQWCSMSTILILYLSSCFFTFATFDLSTPLLLLPESSTPLCVSDFLFRLLFTALQLQALNVNGFC